MRTKFPFFLLPALFWACSGYIGEGTPAGTDTQKSEPVAGGASTRSNNGGGEGEVTNPGPSESENDVPVPEKNEDGLQPSGTDLAGTPDYTRFSRLTNAQWANAVKDLLKLTAVPQTTGLAEPVAHVKAFTNNESLMDVGASEVTSYDTLTRDATKLIATDAALAKVYTGTDAAGFIKAFGRRAYRRPLTDAEATKYQAVYDTGSKLTGSGTAFSKGAGLVIETMLQSPFFLYRVESGQVDKPLDGYEVASKLALWLTESTPSDALLDKAAKLTQPEAIATEAKAMLELPAAANVMRKFHAEWMELARLSDVQKDATLKIPADISDELQELSTKYFDRIYSQNLGLKEILTGTSGYVGPKTATLYGVQATSIALKDFGADRSGYFAQVPYLMALGTFGGQSDPIHRGVHLQQEILCGKLAPPSAMFMLPEQTALQTNRERVAQMTEVNGCKECHGSYINPLGYAFENFDGVGKLRTMDNGAPVDTSGKYPFPGQTADFKGHASLMTSALESDMAHVCYAKKIAGYALGRDIVGSDQAMLDRLAAISKANGSMKDVILALTKDPAFLTRAKGTL